jgi:hypothetical protein
MHRIPRALMRIASGGLIDEGVHAEDDQPTDD